MWETRAESGCGKTGGVVKGSGIVTIEELTKREEVIKKVSSIGRTNLTGKAEAVRTTAVVPGEGTATAADIGTMKGPGRKVRNER